MAALPYMQLYVAEYLADTMHLSTEEHGAYLLIIFNYWQTGKPIPKPRLPKIARLSNDRWISVEVSLSEFFNEVDDEWVHERIELDLEVVRMAQTQRVAAGKASAEARKQAAKAGIAKARNDRSTTVDDPLNENSTNKKRTEEIRQEEVKQPVPDAQSRADYFDRFWKLYPKKKSKADAEKAWSKLKMTDEFFSSIILALSTQAASKDWTKDGGQYVPLAGTWIRGKRWEDEAQSAASNHNGFAQIDYMDGLTVEDDGTLRF